MNSNAQSSSNWREVYDGGSAQAERIAFEKLALDIMEVQLTNKAKSGAAAVDRAFHAKCVLGITNAVLHVLDNIPERFRVGYFQPNSEHRATVRISNASGTKQADSHPDMRGFAIRVMVSDKESHDLLMTNFPVSHARNARQFVAFAKAKANAGDSKLQLVLRLVLSVGPFEAFRMLENVKKATQQPITSVAFATYWSRGATLWGQAGPVRYLMRPAGSNIANAPSLDPEYLHRDIANRLRSGIVTFDLFVQPFVDEQRTPIEDGSIEWHETVSRPVQIATLAVPKQDIDRIEGRQIEQQVDRLAFNPWHTTDDFRPLGNLNRARKQAYAASSAHRLGYRFREHVPVRNVVVSKCVAVIFTMLNQFIPWHRFGWRGGSLNLSVFRDELRANNLIDTEVREAPPMAEPVPPPIPEPARTARTYDGTYNDLSSPNMGSLGSTFGRNMTPVYRPDLFNSPNPIEVSRQLMTREAFIPARSLNLIAAAWIQFQVHDWVNHPRQDLSTQQSLTDVVIPTPDGSMWKSVCGQPPTNHMRIAGNIPVRTTDGYPVFSNISTPWWDGSMVYGENEEQARSLRAGADIRLDGGYLPEDLNGLNVTGFNESWWLGLSMMHTLFAREHNTVCAALRSHYCTWDDERIYQTARLVISALIAKIHTVEWTPAILATKTIDVALHTNWYGAPKDFWTQWFIWFLDTHQLKGIPQTLPNHHAAPYSLTEEFTSVYRLHPLIPDDYQIVNVDDGKSKTLQFDEIQGIKTDAMMRALTLQNVVYSFGIAHPGAITLHNYPRSLQRFRRQNGEIIDLSVVDIVRDRMRGVPRFNDFRAALHKPRLTRWEEISEDPETVHRIKDLYGSIDMVDTMVGLHAEPPPQGFGFSDTAFRIFILMASRRLQSDRFLTVDYRPEIYSPLGIDWVEKNSMTSIILRHCPGLAGIVPRDASAFAPFRQIAF